MGLIRPRTLKGFRDFLPTDARARRRVVAVVTKVFERFGFLPLETPALEYADVLTGKYGDEGEKLMYRFTDQGDRDVALRYDLTVPLARVVAQYENDLPKPFRRYQIATVWRAENTQRGRFREFTQCDIDIVGSAAIAADAEIIAVIASVLETLKVGPYTIRVNNRKLLNSVLAAAGVKEKDWLPILRSIDKWEKIGAEGVRSELSEILSDSQMENFFSLLPKERTEPFDEWSARVSAVISKEGDGKEGLGEMAALLEGAEAIDAPNGTVVFDMLMARGLDYYTGTILEAVIDGQEDFGSVFGGGRYDNLIKQFTGKDIPAVGVSCGLDRLLAAVAENEDFSVKPATASVLVCYVEDDTVAEGQIIANELRKEGINTDLWLDPARLEKQLKYADMLGIPLAVLFGSEEAKKGSVTVKDLRTKKQTRVPRADLVETVNELLGV